MHYTAFANAIQTKHEHLQFCWLFSLKTNHTIISMRNNLTIGTIISFLFGTYSIAHGYSLKDGETQKRCFANEACFSVLQTFIIQHSTSGEDQ